jgi:AraC family transcriptional regulator
VIEIEIKNHPETLLVGVHTRMSMIDNKTHYLWSSLMPRKSEISNVVSSDRYSLQLYQPGYFDGYNPSVMFLKWALLPVADQARIPDEMHPFILPAGDYAVFTHHGDSTGFGKSIYYFHTEWLPNSKYMLDDRPHFEILGEKFKYNDPKSEETVWIPIRRK